MLRHSYNRNRGCYAFLRRLFRVQGSVAPRSSAAAFLTGVVSSFLTWASVKGWFSDFNDFHVTTDKGAWLIYSGLVGFLIVFRMSQAYTRFWQGCAAVHRMRVDWFMAACVLMAYCRASKANPHAVRNFQGKLVRLMSMIHATALAELEQLNVNEVEHEQIAAFQFELLDPAGFDEETLRSVKMSHRKVELIFAWIVMLVVQISEEGVCAPPTPVLSQVFQMLCKGMDAFEDALRITCIPFPFPYLQTCDMVILLHCLMTPVVMVSWCDHPFWAGLLTFLQVFTIQAMDYIALEIEDPFGQDVNDLDGYEMQRQMNNHLVLLLRGKVAPLPDLILGAFDDFEDACLPSRQTVHDVLNGVEGEWVESERANMSFDKGHLRKRQHGTQRRLSPQLSDATFNRENSQLSGRTQDAFECDPSFFPCMLCSTFGSLRPRDRLVPSEAEGSSNGDRVGDRDLFSEYGFAPGGYTSRG